MTELARKKTGKKAVDNRLAGWHPASRPAGSVFNGLQGDLDQFRNALTMATAAS